MRKLICGWTKFEALGTEFVYRYYFETAQYDLGFEAIKEAEATISTGSSTDPTIHSFLYYTQGRLFHETNQPSQSIRSFSKAKHLLDSAGADFLSSSDNNYMLIICSSLSTALVGAKRYNEAGKCHRDAIKFSEGIGNLSNRRLGTLYANLGSCLLWKGDFTQAEAVLQPALLQYGRNLECNLYALGNVYLAQNRYDKALDLHQEVLELSSSRLSHNHHCTADSCHKVGSIFTLKEFSRQNLGEAECVFLSGLVPY